jgi:uncharacterized membrane protein
VSFDPKPFILLNLIFSAQAFFAASFILIAQIRQSARDHAVDEAATLHREELADEQTQRQKQVAAAVGNEHNADHGSRSAHRLDPRRRCAHAVTPSKSDRASGSRREGMPRHEVDAIIAYARYRHDAYC